MKEIGLALLALGAIVVIAVSTHYGIPQAYATTNSCSTCQLR